MKKQAWMWMIPGLLLSTSTFAAPTEKESPWLITPLASIDPKISASVGLMLGYLYNTDAKSERSITLANVNYSASKSVTGAIVSRNYFDANNHKLLVGSFFGSINNEYDNFMDTGEPGYTTDNLLAYGARYLFRVIGTWYIGPQFFSFSYDLDSDDDKTLDTIEQKQLQDTKSVAAGVVIEYDSRDNHNSPYSGAQLAINYNLPRKSLGGDFDAEILYILYKYYHQFNNKHVLATRVKTRQSFDAAPLVQSSIDLRGYVRGENIAPKFFSAEIEGRFVVAQRWRLTAFTGVGCLYDETSDCKDTHNIYPMVGIGGQYVLKMEDRVVVRLEAAKGKGSSYGFYVKFGQSF